MEELIQEYYANNAKKLYHIVDKILFKYGGITDHDEFYALATDIFLFCRDNFDSSKGNFDGFFYSVLSRKIITAIRDKNRSIRSNTKQIIGEDGKITYEFNPDISINTPIGDGDSTLEDMIEDKKISYSKDISDNTETYLSSLSDIQRKIAELIMENYSKDAIKEKLEITDQQFYDAWKVMTSYENKRIIRKEEYFEEDTTMNTVSTEDMAESYKNTSYSIDSISKQLQKKRIRDDHILQRYSGQWKGFAKSDLVSCVLRGKSLTQIIISEEIKDGLRMQWLIDGKQRCTTLDDFLHNGFAISKNIKNYNIKYQTAKVTEDGSEVLNDDGFTEMKFKEFDIRGKKFSQLPEELQDVFKDRQIPVLYNTSCTKKDIADDIARFNRSRPMNAAQNGWLGLDEEFAELADNIAKMNFFLPEFAGTSYTKSNRDSSAIRRVIVESIMVSDFMEDYNSDFGKMCELLSEESSDSNFTEFYSLVDRLSNVCNADVANLFNSTDSFIWLGLFSRFSKLHINDNRFIEFLTEIKEPFTKMKDKEYRENANPEICILAKKIDTKSFYDLCIDPNTGKIKSTKDKSIVTSKLNLLEKLMLDHLHINIEEIQSEESVTIEEQSILDFVRENVGQVLDIDEDGNEFMRDVINDDIKEYREDLDSFTADIDGIIDSKFMEENNMSSLLALVAYGYKDNIQLDGWFIDYFKRNTNYIHNQKQNFEKMRDDLENYISQRKKVPA